VVVSPQAEGGIQTLTKLGLTAYQGRVFLALEQSGSSTARELSRLSGVPRGKIYEVLFTLQETGLVSKTISAPATYEALTLDEAISYLLKRKMKNFKDLRKETSNLLRNYRSCCQDISPTATSNFVLVPNKEAVIQHIRKCMDEAKNCVDFVTSWKRFSKVSSLFTDELRRAGEKGLRLRVVVQRPENYSSLVKIIRSVSMTPFQYRTVDFLPPAIISLYDNKHVLFFTDAETGLKDSPAIVSDNRSFVSLTEIYFEKIWREGQAYEENFISTSPYLCG
jgi:sugar-specific transcriptional regulator TrmB